MQHPLNDTDNSLFLWAQLQSQSTTHLILMSTLPNESKASSELLFIPRFSYSPPQCAEFLQFRSVVLNRQQATTLGNSDDANDDDSSSRDSNSSFAIRESGRFNQLMLFLYTERSANDFTLRVSPFLTVYNKLMIVLNISCFRAACLIWMAIILVECHVTLCLIVRLLNNVDSSLISVHQNCRSKHLRLL